MYSEGERLVTAKHLNTFNLNPFAFDILMDSYIKNIHPRPVKFTYWMKKPDQKMDKVAVSKMVELHIATAGYLGKEKGSPEELDRIGAELFCRSYYEELRPMAVSFQVFNAVEVHLRTPGVSDSDEEAFNPLADIKFV